MNVNIGLGDILVITPMIILFLTACIPVAVKVLRGNHEPSPGFNLLVVCLGILLAGAALAIFSLEPGTRRMAFDNSIVLDGTFTWVANIVLIMTLAAVFLSFENAATSGRQYSEFLFLLLTSAIGMMIVACSNDLIVLFIGIEVMSLALYILIGMSHETKLSKEASFKYFVLGSFASALFLYGIALIFGVSGTTYLNELAPKMTELFMTNRLFVLGAGLVTVGLCFKVSIFPFHAWTPDVYEGAPTPITGFMATAVKAVIFAAFLRFITLRAFSGPSATSFIDFLQWLAVLTMLVGNIAALMQKSVKRMLAYSSIAHSGYLMVGLIAAAIDPSGIAGATAVLFYLFSYAIMTMGAFAFICLFEKTESTIVYFDDLKGTAKKHPWTSMGFTICMLSLAGIPPTLGFFGKFYLFSAALHEGLIWLAVWGVINSVISVAYYLRPVVTMYMQDSDTSEQVAPLFLARGTLVAAATALLIAGIFSSPLFHMVETSVISLFS